jgi:hypothetical protein
MPHVSKIEQSKKNLFDNLFFVAAMRTNIPASELIKAVEVYVGAGTNQSRNVIARIMIKTLSGVSDLKFLDIIIVIKVIDIRTVTKRIT